MLHEGVCGETAGSLEAALTWVQLDQRSWIGSHTAIGFDFLMLHIFSGVALAMARPLFTKVELTSIEVSLRLPAILSSTLGSLADRQV